MTYPCHLPGFDDVNGIWFMIVPSEFQDMMKRVTAAVFHSS
jgi:hypothetical protein